MRKSNEQTYENRRSIIQLSNVLRLTTLSVYQLKWHVLTCATCRTRNNLNLHKNNGLIHMSVHVSDQPAMVRF